MAIEICEDCIARISICEDCGESIADPHMDRCWQCERRERERIERERVKREIESKIESGRASKITIAATIDDRAYYQIGEIVRIAATREGIDYYQIDLQTAIGGREIVNNSGKIAKRLRNALRRDHDLRLLDPEVSEIGNIARQNSNESGEYAIEISSNFTEYVGSFGDSGSCFRSGSENWHHGEAIDNDPDCGIVAIYRASGERIARSIYYTPESGGIVIFNAYGLRLNQIADLVERIYSGERREIAVYGEIWINSGGGIAIGIDREHYDQTISIPADPDGEHCQDCEQVIGEDHQIWHDGDLYCEDCYSERFQYCEQCDHNYDRHWIDFQYVEIGRYHGWVCEDCVSDHYLYCEQCGEYRERDQVMFSDCGEICEDCGIVCEDCERLHDPNYVIESESGDLVCEDCERDRESERDRERRAMRRDLESRIADLESRIERERDLALQTIFSFVGDPHG
jgi:hypothetical protein